jgi:hypothetical protein
MTSIGNIIFRAVALWIYVGIGPLLGCGPLDAGKTMPRRARNAAAIGNRSQDAPTGSRR